MKTTLTADRIYELRTQAGLSHQRLSDELKETMNVNISKNSLMNYEQRSTASPKFGSNEGMSVKNLFALASFFNVSTDYILGLSDTKSPNVDVKIMAEHLGLREEIIVELMKYQLSNADAVREASNAGTLYATFTSIINAYLGFITAWENAHKVQECLFSLTSIHDERINLSHKKNSAPSAQERMNMRCLLLKAGERVISNNEYAKYVCYQLQTMFGQYLEKNFFLDLMPPHKEG